MKWDEPVSLLVNWSPPVGWVRLINLFQTSINLNRIHRKYAMKFSCWWPVNLVSIRISDRSLPLNRSIIDRSDIADKPIRRDFLRPIRFAVTFSRRFYLGLHPFRRFSISCWSRNSFILDLLDMCRVSK